VLIAPADQSRKRKLTWGSSLRAPSEGVLAEGLIRHLGISTVSAEQVAEAPGLLT